MENIEFGCFQIVNNVIIENLSSKQNFNKAIINFDLNESIKIIPSFKTIKEVNLNKLLNTFKNFNIELRTDDLLGKLHIVLLRELLNGASTFIYISDMGFTTTSINFLKSNFDKIMPNFNDKAIVLCIIKKQDNISRLHL